MMSKEPIALQLRFLQTMLPYTPVHHLLFRSAAFTALVMTSGNLSEEPIVVENHDARERLGKVADWFLTHNRDIYMRADDSVVRIFEGEERVMRRSRGYAPQTLDLGRNLQPNYEQMEFACTEGEQDLQHYTESEGARKK